MGKRLLIFLGGAADRRHEGFAIKLAYGCHVLSMVSLRANKISEKLKQESEDWVVVIL